MITLVTAAMLAVYPPLSGNTIRSPADAVVPLSLTVASAWALYIKTNSILYIGVAALLLATSSLSGVAGAVPKRTRRVVAAMQTVVPLAVIVALSILKPPYFYTPVIAIACAAAKLGAWDQIRIEEYGKLL